MMQFLYSPVVTYVESFQMNHIFSLKEVDPGFLLGYLFGSAVKTTDVQRMLFMSYHT